ncbi:MAG: aminotransferase class I/II-fold pyridoxal phosphate-dependent enzyme, partial [Vampirovibrionia bacterium]
AFINDGEGYKKIYKEKIVILSNSPNNYARIIQKNDAIVETITPKDLVAYDINELLLKIKRIKPQVIIIDNPRILTGTYLDKEQIYTLIENIPEETIIVFDESLYSFAENENEDFYSATNLIFDFSNLIVLRSFSFVHAMAGMRLGYSISQENIANCIDSARHPFDVSPFSLYTAIKTLQSSDVFEKVTLKYVQEQKDLMYKYLNEMGLYYIKSSTNSITFSTPIPSEELHKDLLEYKIVIKPLWDNFIRFTIGEQKDNIYFIKSLKMILSSKLHN